MDKNTAIGFILIGLVLVLFTWLNKPSQEQIEAQRRYRDSIAMVQAQNQNAALEQAQAETATFNQASLEGLTDSAKQAALQNNFGAFASAAIGSEEFITLENNKIEVKISTKGGHVTYARIKDYVTYSKEPLVLFDGDDSKFNITLVTANNRIVNTSELYFQPTGVSNNSVTMRLPVDGGGFIDFAYALSDDDYMLGFSIKGNGLNGILAPSTNSLDIQWSQKMRSLEKGRKLELQYTGLYYKFLADDVEHFGENKDDDKQLSNRLKWIGYKNKFFASTLIADDALTASRLTSKQINNSDKYLKEFNTITSVEFNPAGNEPVGFRYFFGPTQYKLLRAYDKDIDSEKKLNLDNLVPMGYKWVRPISKYIVLPLFDFLGKFFKNYGVIILIMTLIIKLVISPLTYKSYMSQAKMRVLRPQVEALKAKYPKKEQAMELQQATMALYSSAGASPMSGCLPALLPFPILIALFWLFPTAIELRQQSFLWAEDLSTYDDVFSWNTNIPLISSFLGNHISLFCLLMTIVQIVSMKITTAMSNTGQQQMPGMNMMMYIMPIMFFFMFNQNSSGLCYYYLISTLIALIQTGICRLTVNEDKLLAKLEANKKKPKKKSGFMKRLEEAQRKQQEMLRKQQQQQRR